MAYPCKGSGTGVFPMTSERALDEDLIKKGFHAAPDVENETMSALSLFESVPDSNLRGSLLESMQCLVDDARKNSTVEITLGAPVLDALKMSDAQLESWFQQIAAAFQPVTVVPNWDVDQLHTLLSKMLEREIPETQISFALIEILRREQPLPHKFEMVRSSMTEALIAFMKSALKHGKFEQADAIKQMTRLWSYGLGVSAELKREKLIDSRLMVLWLLPELAASQFPSVRPCFECRMTLVRKILCTLNTLPQWHNSILMNHRSTVKLFEILIELLQYCLNFFRLLKKSFAGLEILSVFDDTFTSLADYALVLCSFCGQESNLKLTVSKVPWSFSRRAGNLEKMLQVLLLFVDETKRNLEPLSRLVVSCRGFLKQLGGATTSLSSKPANVDGLEKIGPATDFDGICRSVFAEFFQQDCSNTETVLHLEKLFAWLFEWALSSRKSGNARTFLCSTICTRFLSLDGPALHRNDRARIFEKSLLDFITLPTIHEEIEVKQLATLIGEFIRRGCFQYHRFIQRCVSGGKFEPESALNSISIYHKLLLCLPVFDDVSAFHQRRILLESMRLKDPCEDQIESYFADIILKLRFDKDPNTDDETYLNRMSDESLCGLRQVSRFWQVRISEAVLELVKRHIVEESSGSISTREELYPGYSRLTLKQLAIACRVMELTRATYRLGQLLIWVLGNSWNRSLYGYIVQLFKRHQIAFSCLNAFGEIAAALANRHEMLKRVGSRDRSVDSYLAELLKQGVACSISLHALEELELRRTVITSPNVVTPNASSIMLPPISLRERIVAELSRDISEAKVQSLASSVAKHVAEDSSGIFLAILDMYKLFMANTSLALCQIRTRISLLARFLQEVRDYIDVSSESSSVGSCIIHTLSNTIIHEDLLQFPFPEDNRNVKPHYGFVILFAILVSLGFRDVGSYLVSAFIPSRLVKFKDSPKQLHALLDLFDTLMITIGQPSHAYYTFGTQEIQALVSFRLVSMRSADFSSQVLRTLLCMHELEVQCSDDVETALKDHLNGVRVRNLKLNSEFFVEQVKTVFEIFTEFAETLSPAARNADRCVILNDDDPPTDRDDPMLIVANVTYWNQSISKFRLWVMLDLFLIHDLEDALTRFAIKLVRYCCPAVAEVGDDKMTSILFLLAGLNSDLSLNILKSIARDLKEHDDIQLNGSRTKALVLQLLANVSDDFKKLSLLDVLFPSLLTPSARDETAVVLASFVLSTLEDMQSATEHLSGYVPQLLQILAMACASKQTKLIDVLLDCLKAVVEKTADISEELAMTPTIKQRLQRLLPLRNDPAPCLDQPPPSRPVPLYPASIARYKQAET